MGVLPLGKFAAVVALAATTALTPVRAQVVDWAVTPGSSSACYPDRSRFAVDPAGDVYVAACPNTDYFPYGYSLLKLRGSNGQGIWLAAAVGTDYAYLYDPPSSRVVLAPDGNVVVSATVSGDSSFGVVAKIDAATGQELWSRRGLEDAIAYGYNLSTRANGDVDLDGLTLSGQTGAPIANTTSSSFSPPFGRAPGMSTADLEGNLINVDQVGTAIRVTKTSGTTGAVIWTFNRETGIHDVRAAGVLARPDRRIFVFGAAAYGSGALVMKIHDIAQPGAPGVQTAPRVGGVQVMLTPPADDGHSPVTFYGVTCGGVSVGINVLPGSTGESVFVAVPPGMTTCQARAFNAAGRGTDSPAVAGVSLAPLQLLAVVSPKVHGTAGNFEIPLSTLYVRVEPRAAGDGHRVVFRFDRPPLGFASASLDGNAPASAPVMSGSEIAVDIGIVAQGRHVLRLLQVDDIAVIQVEVAYLRGDVNQSGTVDDTDLAAARAATGQPVTQANFRLDTNLTGSITVADLLGVKRSAGQSVPLD